MATIQLTKGYVALVDEEDADLAKHRWRAIVDDERLIYARRHLPAGSEKTYAALHREVAERACGPIPPGMVVDHINGDTLDNRRANLRITTDQHNRWNRHRAYRNSSSGIVGVVFRPEMGKWRARISIDGKNRGLGHFDTLEEALAARRAAEAERWATAA